MNDLENPIRFCMPPRVVLDVGARHRIAALCAVQGWKQVLVVTDAHFSTRSTVIDELRASLAKHEIGATVFDGGQPDPSVELCDQASRDLLAGTPSFDAVIAVGGGSNIDLAKALCLTLAMPRPVLEFVGLSRFPGTPLPLVAVPTTSGTGSEITAGSILVHTGNATKVAVMGNALRPVMAIIDPELTLTCPAKVTADAGLDALTHAIESYVTMDAAEFDTGGDPDPAYSGRNPLTMLLAHEAIRLCFRHLPAAYQQPHDLTARVGMAQASLFAAMSYASAGLNAVHGLAYALAGVTHASHGSTNAVMLPYVMDALVPMRTTELAEIALLAGNVDAVDPVEAARRAPVLTRTLVTQLGLAGNLRDFGVESAAVDTLVAEGLKVTRLAKAFALQPPDAAYSTIVANAFSGRLSGTEHA